MTGLFFSFLWGHAFLVLPDDNAWTFFFLFKKFIIVGFFSLFLLIARIPSGKVFLVTPDREVWKFRASWLQGWPNNSWSRGLKIQYFLITGLAWRLFLMAGLIFSFLWAFPNFWAYLIFFLFQDQNHDSLLFINSMILSLSTILLNYIEDFS